MKLSMICIAAAVLAVPASAGAVVTVSLTGRVSHVNGDPASRFSIGDLATAVFAYDPSSPGQPFYDTGTYFLYPNAVIGGFMRVGTYNVSFSQSSRVFVTNQESAGIGPIDRVLLDDHDPIGLPVAGRAIDVVAISWQDNSATALDNLSLPTNGAAFARFPLPNATIDWAPYLGAEHRVQIAFERISVSAIPEPATWAMMIGGLGMIGGAMRRRRVSAKVSFA